MTWKSHSTGLIALDGKANFHRHSQTHWAAHPFGIVWANQIDTGHNQLFSNWFLHYCTTSQGDTLLTWANKALASTHCVRLEPIRGNSLHYIQLEIDKLIPGTDHTKTANIRLQLEDFSSAVNCGTGTIRSKNRTTDWIQIELELQIYLWWHEIVAEHY